MNTGFCDIGKKVHTVIVELLLSIIEATATHEIDKLSSSEIARNLNRRGSSYTFEGKSVAVDISIQCYGKAIGYSTSGSTCA